MGYDIVFRSEELRAIVEGRNRRYSSVVVKQLQRTLEKLRLDPTGLAHAERLKHKYSGLRSVRVTGKYRLLYKLCADCLQDPMFCQNNPLPCCLGEEPADPNRVNLLRVGDYHR